MSKTQIIILVVLGVSVIAVFSGLGIVVHDTMSSVSTPRVGRREPLTSVTVPPTTTISTQKTSPTVQITGDQNETTCRVEAFLRDLGYDVIAVRAATNETGDRTLAAHVRESTAGAEGTLIDVNSVVCLYVATTTSPFDSASVVIYSPEDRVIITSVVVREDIKAWIDGNISTDQFINCLSIQSQLSEH
jgi:hypothetical protein